MNQTKKFWKLGWMLFGGKFIRFMTGYKNTTQVTFGDTSRGNFNPETSDINFAVPDIKVLRNFKPYGDNSPQNTRHPGIFLDLLEEVAKALPSTSVCLSFDGKKLKQGLTESNGDINLLGFEEGESLFERQQRFQV